jgi:DNA-directed RNA polymerase subunit RPC12/RpoP
MTFKMINESFVCENCWQMIEKHPKGSARNHCPFCLYSKHLDHLSPWDRLSKCQSIMKPIWIDHKKNKWWMIKHQCIKCHKEIINKIAPDDHYIEFIQLLNSFS